MRTIYKNATILDCVTPQPMPSGAVVVEDGKIAQIAPSNAITPTEQDVVVDLNGSYLLPGLWDVHVHPDYYSSAPPNVADQTTLFGHRMQAALFDAGIMGMRCCGTHNYLDVAWRNAYDSGQYVGPRLFASGHFLTTTGGHFLGSGHALECDGPYGFVKAIREQIKNGVDFIKLNLSGGIVGPKWDLHTQSFYFDEELQAAFEICKMRGFKIIAHATHPGVVKEAIKRGAHSIEHGYIMDDECIELLLKHDTWLVPTLAISHLTPKQATNKWESDFAFGKGWSHALCCRAEAAAPTHADWFERAVKAGVKMALGSDIRPLKDAALLEMGLWTRSGASTWHTLQAATKHGAEICGVGHEMGTIETGKIADMIVVKADPLQDINNLRQLELVIKNGKIVSDKRRG
jgi:imidazolonepropionase-like amidohydrolase